jgi:hypothetical protein
MLKSRATADQSRLSQDPPTTSTVVASRSRRVLRDYPTEQSQLHTFFAPAIDLADRQLVAYLRAITARHPSLPQKAGRALAKLRRALDMQQPHSAPAIRTPLTRVSDVGVRGVVRSKPDIEKLVIALRMLAEHQVRTGPDASPNSGQPNRRPHHSP